MKRRQSMVDNSMTFNNTLMQLGGENYLRELTVNRIMEADATQRSYAEHHKCTNEREACSNGASTTSGPAAGSAYPEIA